MNSPRSRPAPQHSGPAEGAVAGFETLYRANVTAVTAYFARRSAEPHTVADLTADTFVAAITSFATFDPRKGTARAWVFGIARRIYAAHCQEHGQQRSRVERLAGRRELAPDEIGDLIDRIDAERAGRALVTGLTRLPAPTGRWSSWWTWRPAAQGSGPGARPRAGHPADAALAGPGPAAHGGRPGSGARHRSRE